MYRLGVILLMLSLAACEARPQTEVAAVERVRSVQSITILDETGSEQTLLIAGVRGPDVDTVPVISAEARAALDVLLEQGAIAHTPTGDPDRYGRMPSQITLANELDLSTALVGAGWAMVWPRLGQGADFQSLYEAEARARDQGLGAWGEGVFIIRDPDPNRLAPHLDSAQIIEGRVISTGSARDGRVFINFGLDWRTDFTVVADEDAVERFAETGIELVALEGTIIRVRGWMYELNGPSLTLVHPAQLEIVDAPDVPTLPR